MAFHQPELKPNSYMQPMVYSSSPTDAKPLLVAVLFRGQFYTFELLVRQCKFFGEKGLVPVLVQRWVYSYIRHFAVMRFFHLFHSLQVNQIFAGLKSLRTPCQFQLHEILC